MSEQIMIEISMKKLQEQVNKIRTENLRTVDEFFNDSRTLFSKRSYYEWMRSAIDNKVAVSIGTIKKIIAAGIELEDIKA